MQRKTELEEAREKGLKLKALHDAEMVPFGERGEFRPRSRGQTYDIPPTDGTYCPDKVDQTGKDTVDLDKVLSRFEKTGKLTELIALGQMNPAGFQYGDFTGAPDFQEALQISIHAEQQFAMLDAKVRNRFLNDPAQFLAFATNPANVDEMETLGLLKPEVVKARQAARRAGSIALPTTAAPEATPTSPAAPASS